MSRGLVLNVNDREGPRYTLSETLRRAGFEVVEATSGHDALRIVDDTPGLEVIVLDVHLPDIDGFEVTRRMREKASLPHVKILSTSATFVTLANKVQGLQAGADGYLTQPFEREELVAVVDNLIKLSRAEQELAQRAERLADNDRRKDEFLAMLAHELRNPLAAIHASLSILEMREPATEPETRAREILRRQTKQLNRLVDDLLDVARVTQGKVTLSRSAIDLREVVEQCIANVQRDQRGSQSRYVAVNLPAVPAWVDGDASRLEQVLSNLLDNARKYSEPGTRVHVSLEIDARQREVVLSVRDEGIGIDPAVIGEIFELFSQADAAIDRSRGGLGIGLTLVRTIVSLHGGTVAARSPGVGQGSTFEVRLPLARPAAAGVDAGQEAHAGNGGTQGSRRVLIVEDNADARQPLADLCNMWGHEVFVAHDGDEGLSRAIEHRPDVAFVDIGLPGKNGYELARAIRAQPEVQDMMLVAFTGYGAARDRELAREAGFDMHVVKPIDIPKLKILLEDLRREA